MSAAGGAQSADTLWVDIEGVGMRLEPACAEIDVGHRGRIGVLRRHAKVQRGDHTAVRGQPGVDAFVLGAGLRGPGAAMHIDQGRERPLALRPV